MFRRISLILFLIISNIVSAQVDIKRFSESQRIFFVAEEKNLLATTNNPASIGINDNNSGFILSYDFENLNYQGNSSAYISFNNFGFFYQDVYSINSVRLQNYAVSLSVGDDIISLGNSLRFINASYPDNDLNYFSFDGGILFKPLEFISFGLLARNINQIRLDSINYERYYSAGLGLFFLDKTFNLFAEAYFKDNSKIDNLTATTGLTITPIEILEIRAAVTLNPEDLKIIRNEQFQSIDLNYESFLGASVKLFEAIKIGAAVFFNDRGEKTSFTTFIALPL
ncbi:MAG: hypothetical protein HZC46_06425 [Ignavibacterium album]|uniref:hypothetical protein n=1 Tax=Ignavibacterium album TaxID=591197 RepID=UPI0026F1D920|nr:hypothetical protein [Ignavibacterium album]MBI5661762.1 hypothetical protein [Ignavibacterium album]